MSSQLRPVDKGTKRPYKPNPIQGRPNLGRAGAGWYRRREPGDIGPEVVNYLHPNEFKLFIDYSLTP